MSLKVQYVFVFFLKKLILYFAKKGRLYRHKNPFHPFPFIFTLIIWIDWVWERVSMNGIAFRKEGHTFNLALREWSKNVLCYLLNQKENYFLCTPRPFCLYSFILVLAFIVWAHTAASVGPAVLVCFWDWIKTVLWTVEGEFIQVEAMGNVAPGRRKDAFKCL